MMDYRLGKVTWGSGEDRIRTSGENWKQPYKWDRAAAKAGRIDTVFCLSLGDIWDNEVDPLWRRQAFEVMNKTPNLVYLLLSKRIGNAVKMCDPLAGNECLPGNAALGATMVNQEEWDRDIQKLKDAGDILGAKFTFASVEPMLGPINMRGTLPDWVIVGGETGVNARPLHPMWVRYMRDQCEDAGVPFFFKQWGDLVPAELIPNDSRPEPWRRSQNGNEAWSFTELSQPRDALPNVLFSRVGKSAAGRRLDGVEYNSVPFQIERPGSQSILADTR
jgi:protein gp37